MAKKKVNTGMEFVAAEAIDAEVYFKPMLQKFKLHVGLKRCATASVIYSETKHLKTLNIPKQCKAEQLQQYHKSQRLIAFPERTTKAAAKSKTRENFGEL